MLVKVMVVDIHIPFANSLKDKRRVIKSIKERTRNKFNVSISELDGFDLHRRSSLGVAMIGNDSSYLDQSLDKILDLIYENYEVEVLELFRENRWGSYVWI